jgi:branched-chain amino acid transport system ATP-binding protein
MPSDELLRVDSVSKSFGGVRAVDKVSLTVTRNRLTGLIGPNGAGKTSLLNLISGLYRPASGRIFLDGADVTGASPEQLVASGLTRTFQNLQIFGRLSVFENVMVAAHARDMTNLLALCLPTSRARRAEESARARAEAALSKVGLDAEAHRAAEGQPYGVLNRLELARALALEPRCLLLDEPAAGCNPTEANELRDLIRHVADGGVTVVVVEHNMRLIMSICEEIFVLDRGALLTAGTPQQIQQDARVVAAYLGTEQDDQSQPAQPERIL